MRVVRIQERRDEDAFAEKAAKAFAADPTMTSYTEGDIVPGTLLALRWGLHNRAVAVLALSETHEPMVYSDLVPVDEDVPF